MRLNESAHRMTGMKSDPDHSGTHWKRPRDVRRGETDAFLNQARTDYALQLQKFDSNLGSDDQLLKELEERTDRPEFPQVG
jgi:hypothetical protein